MKTTIIDILNKIANGEEPPKIIIYKNKRYWYVNKEKDYYLDANYDEALFDSYVITDILNDEVEILETTITGTKLGTIIGYKKGETDNAGYIGVVDKINEDGSVCLKQDKIEKLDEWDFSGNDLIFAVKINEIIDRINNV